MIINILMTVDYYKVVKKIADAYSSGGYSSLWSRLKDLKENLGESCFKIIYEVVEEGFLKPRNSNSSTRVFGLGDFEIEGLAKECIKLEEIKLKPLVERCVFPDKDF